MTIAVLHLFCLVSQDRCDFVAICLRTLLRVTGHENFETMPKDTRTILGALSISPVTRAFVCCPRCCKLYLLPENNPKAGVLENDQIRGHCEYQSTPNSAPCGRSLIKRRKVKGVEIKSYARLFFYQTFQDWLARFLCRPGMEDLVDRDVLADGSLDFQNDIWDGSVLRNLKDSDGNPFIVKGGNKGLATARYVFAFCWDGFNPLGNREAGKKISSCAMYMICLNLPIDERYKRENIYLVAIIPGPNEPSREQINHFAAPLIDDFQEFWRPGYFLERTANHPLGRSVMGAIVPLVADLLAIRQIAGYASHSSLYICSFCWTTMDFMDDLSQPLVKRCPKEHRRLAAQWDKAVNEEDRAALFEKYGIRHSEFLRLPYWNPVEFLAIDSMHAFLLGNLKRHCRGIWGFDVSLVDGDGDRRPVEPPLPPQGLMEKGEGRLRISKKSGLFKLSKPVLFHLCSRYNCLPVERHWRKKKGFVRELCKMVR